MTATTFTQLPLFDDVRTPDPEDPTVPRPGQPEPEPVPDNGEDEDRPRPKVA